MIQLLEKLVLALLCSTLLFDSTSFTEPVVAVLLSVTVSCLLQSVNARIPVFIISALFIVACFGLQSVVVFLPLLAYDLMRHRLYLLFVPAYASLLFAHFEGLGALKAIAIIIFSVIALVIENLDRRMTSLEHELIVTRDNAVEYNNELRRKNKQILDAQDNEIHLATLKERNRIAREIHDNVGHMLTRTILQMGALQIINKDENLQEPLDSIKNTLDEAMNSIRSSVHDLHDESVDLEASMRDAVAPLREKFNVSFEYDITGAVSGKIKYCFIALTKEAVNNIIKHSNGNRAVITLREHPGMFTLLVEDNGVCPESVSAGGIGLENMRERVASMGGNINITSGKDGFRIFASILK